jgi:succinate dehydrogenase/fumarate reductase flavoprotein subunit
MGRRKKFYPQFLKESEVIPIDPNNPLKDQIPQLDDFIARGLAAGLSVPELMAQVLPSTAQEQKAKAERIRADNERKTAKRLARIAAQNDPAKLEIARAKFQKRMRETARRKAARLQRLEHEAQEKAKALADNPTLRWRHPRRKDWAAKNLAK